MKFIRNRHIEKLVRKWDEGTATPAEELEIDEWYDNEPNHPIYLHEDFAESEEDLGFRMYTRIQRDIRRLEPMRARRWLITTGAALALLALSIGIYYYRVQEVISMATVSHDIAPGGDYATLILSDGSRIALDEVQDGKLAEQAGIEVSKTAEGQLVYRLSAGKASAAEAKVSFHTIETPKGGQYQVVLPDGTRVWLNASTSFRYPLSFATSSRREVGLLYGEAYFEVSEDAAHPFVVHSDRQQTQVIGTHFNINAYSDEETIKTTLLSGAVKVTDLLSEQDVLLRPGQQSIVGRAGMRVQTLGDTNIILWKDGKFVFDNEPMSAVMRQIARWYKVRVVYRDAVQDVRLSGSVSRFENISTLLEKLEQTGLVRFKREDDLLTVMKPLP